MIQLRAFVFAFLVAASAASALEDEERADDADARARARLAVEGPRTPEGMAELLRATTAEAQRIAAASREPASRPRVVQAAAASAGPAVWVNLGPAGTDDNFNGSAQIATGLVSSISVDPADANIVYVLTSDGGAWKSFDALAPLTSSTGPHWQPITDALGTTEVGCLAINPGNSLSLLAGTKNGAGSLFYTDDGGATWTAPGGAPLAAIYGGLSYRAGAVWDVKFGSSSTAIAATDVGLFRSTQGGVAAWTFVDATTTHTVQNYLGLAWVGGQTWLATATEYGSTSLGHLYRSTDDGVSWAEVTPPAAASDVSSMTVAAAPSDRSDPAHARAYLLAANTASPSAQKDVFSSNDGGVTWTSLGMSAGSGRAPTNPTYNAYSSNTYGDQHQSDLDVLKKQGWHNRLVAVDPANHDHVFVGGQFAMVRSFDGGATWDVVADWSPQSGSFTAGSGSPLPATMYLHADYHAAAFASSGSASYVFVGTDGGLFRSSDALAAGVPHWETRLNRGVVSDLFYSVRTGAERTGNATCAAPANAADMMIGGLQDNGTRVRALSTDPTLFDTLSGGDGFGAGMGCVCAAGASGCTATQSTSGSLLLATYVSVVNRSVDGGATFQQATTGFPTSLDPNYTFFMKLAPALSDALGHVFYTVLTTQLTTATDCASGTQCYHGYVYATTDGAQGWTNATSVIHTAAGTTRANMPYPAINVGVDPLRASHVGAVSLYQPYATVDGSTWYEGKTVANGSGGSARLGAIAVDSSDATGNSLWVGSDSTAFSDGRPIVATFGHLYRCTTLLTDQCARWTPSPESSGLPNVPVSVIKQSPIDANVVYVGTWIGVYRSTDHGATWSRLGTGLPLVRVMDLAIAADGSSIRAATYGRGLWELNAQPGGSLTGLHGSGDFDGSQSIDGFDLVREAAALQSDSSLPDYVSTANLVGAVNAVDAADFQALFAKFGGRP